MPHTITRSCFNSFGLLGGAVNLRLTFFRILSIACGSGSGVGLHGGPPHSQTSRPVKTNVVGLDRAHLSEFCPLIYRPVILCLPVFTRIATNTSSPCTNSEKYPPTPAALTTMTIS